MDNKDENNNVTGLEKLAENFQLHRKNDTLNLQEMAKFFQLQAAHLPAGIDKKRNKRSPCTQFPWAADKNKSSIPLGDSLELDNDSSVIKASSKKYFPWSHQHESTALDFGESTETPQSQYKADYVTKNESGQEQELYGRCSKNSNYDKRSLSGTNIRVGKHNNKSCSPPDDEDQQRWTLKTLGKKSHPTLQSVHNVKQKEVEKKELLLISQLSVDEALDKLRKEKTETNSPSKYSTRPF